MIPDGWSFIPLEDLASVERGKFSVRPRNDPKYYGGNIPFVQTGDVREANGWIRTFSQTLNEEGLKVSRTFPPNTILITIAANIGEVGLTTFEVACPDSIVGIQAKRGVSPIWLMYALQARKPDIESFATQNAQKNINLEILRPFQILTPPLPEQRKIAAILSTWDEAITLTERLSEALRQRKQALMQLLIANSWECMRLDDICTFIKDGTHFSPQSDSGPFRYITSKNIRFGKLDLSECEYISLEEHERIYQSCPVQYGDLLITKDGVNVGNAALNTLREPFSLLSSVAVIRADPVIATNSYLLQFFLSPHGQHTLSDLIAGQAITRLTLTTIKALPIPLPPLAEQQRISAILSAADEEISFMECLTDMVHSEKRGLMQQLLTGAIRVQVDG